MSSDQHPELQSSITSGKLAWKWIRDTTLQDIGPRLKTDKITHLDLSNNWITSKGLETLFSFISANDSITSLDISYNQIEGSTGAQAIANFLKIKRNLIKLNISWNQLKQEIGTVFKALPAARKLESFTYEGNLFSTAVFNQLAEVIPRTVSLQTVEPASARSISAALQDVKFVRQRKMALWFWRKNASDSPFYHEIMPLDIFRLIFDLI